MTKYLVIKIRKHFNGGIFNLYCCGVLQPRGSTRKSYVPQRKILRPFKLQSYRIHIP